MSAGRRTVDPVHEAGGPDDPRELTGRDVVVAGAGVSGRAAARALQGLGARVTLVDDGPSAGEGVAAADEEVGRVARRDLVVTSPGLRPGNPLLAAAAAAGLPVWGDVELAWRCDRAGVFGAPRRWLVVTGTNGKTTTTSMLQSILEAAGEASAACGNIGLPVPDALAATPRNELLAMELSSFQLHWAPSVVPDAAVVLNIAEDHLDWHGGMAAYTRAKAQVLRGRVGVVGLDDPATAALAGHSAAQRTVGFTAGVPGAGQLGLRSGELVDRAFADVCDGLHGTPLIGAERVTPQGTAGRLDALAAAALARAVGVPARAVGAGLENCRVGPHRAAYVATVDGVDYVDDSKATNPHAAAASIAGRTGVVWIAGGLLKGASVDELVASAAPHLSAAVLLGRDRAILAEALARHAPDIPVARVSTREDVHVETDRDASSPAGAAADGVLVEDDSAVMDAVVEEASRYARSGHTVLLAPAAASLDMYRNYGERGDAFAAAVGRLRTRR